MITLASHGYLFVGKVIVQAGTWGTSTSLNASAPETLTTAIVKARKNRRSLRNGVGIGGARVFAGHVGVSRFCAAQYIQVGGRQSHERCITPLSRTTRQPGSLPIVQVIFAMGFDYVCECEVEGV